MPGLRLENKAVQEYLWGRKSSVVQSYLRDGIDGWRLDVAFELGPKLLTDLTKKAHKAKPGSWVVGEISGYPSNWFPAVDGVFNFSSLNVGIRMLDGSISGGRAGRMYQDMVEDAGIENLLKSWILPENHDTPRLASTVKDAETRNLLKALQFTLPGSPCVYYGLELGMDGAGDPQNRAPMQWDLATEKNGEYMWLKKLSAVRKSLPALRYGDFTALQSDKLLAFARTTDKVRETVFVVMNPTDKTVKETMTTRVGRVMSWGELEDVFTGAKMRSITGLLEVEVKPRTVMIFKLKTDPFGGYSPYDRVG
jgi:glycosidase